MHELSGAIYMRLSRAEQLRRRDQIRGELLSEQPRNRLGSFSQLYCSDANSLSLTLAILQLYVLSPSIPEIAGRVQNICAFHQQGSRRGELMTQLSRKLLLGQPGHHSGSFLQP